MTDAALKKLMEPIDQRLATVEGMAEAVAEAIRLNAAYASERERKLHELRASKRPFSIKETAEAWRKTVEDVRYAADAGKIRVNRLSRLTFTVPFDEVVRAAPGLIRYHGIQHPDDDVFYLPWDSWSRFRSKPTADDSCVYFVQAATTRLIKIGIANNFQSRFCALQSMSPDKLQVMAILFGHYRQEERRLHKLFAKDRSHGEWFEPSKKLLKHIRGIQLRTDSPVLRSQWVLAA